MLKQDVISQLKSKIKNKKQGRKSLSGGGTSPTIKISVAPEIRLNLEKLATKEDIAFADYIRIILEEHVSENAKFLE